MTAKDGTGVSWKNKTRLTLEEALDVVAFGQVLTPEDYAARDMAQRTIAIEQAFKDLCDAVSQSHVILIGDTLCIEKRKWRTETIPWKLFGPSRPGEPELSYPLDYERPIEPMWSIVWDRDGDACLEWKNVYVDRPSLDQWLRSRAPDPAQQAPVEVSAPPVRQKRRGRPPKHTPECEEAARRIAAEKKASTNPSDKTDTALIVDFQAWHENEYPDKSIPVRETVRSWLTEWGL